MGIAQLRISLVSKNLAVAFALFLPVSLKGLILYVNISSRRVKNTLKHKSLTTIQPYTIVVTAYIVSCFGSRTRLSERDKRTLDFSLVIYLYSHTSCWLYSFELYRRLLIPLTHYPPIILDNRICHLVSRF